MKSAPPALLALLLTVHGVGCGQDDHIVGSRSARPSGNAGWSSEAAGGNSATTVSVSAGTSGAAHPAGGGAAGSVKPGPAGGGSAANFGRGGAMSVGNDGGGSNAGGTSGLASGGHFDSGGSGGVPQNGGDGGGLSLSPTNGWVDGASNLLSIQGAFFADADSTSIYSLRANFTGARTCIQGTAAKVDQASVACQTRMFTPPAADCYGEYWGAELGLYLNQPAMGGKALPFDASVLQGFAFEISGDTVPAPSALRFQVEGPDGEFCNNPPIKIKGGLNTVLLSDLAIGCWSGGTQTADSAKSGLIRIEWRVVTNASSVVPYDFCVSNIRALHK